MIDHILERIGLNKKEISIFLTILDRQKVSAQKISTHTGVKRTTVYSILNELIKKGFVIEDRGAVTRYFMIPDEDILLQAFSSEQNELILKKKKLKELTNEISKIPKSKN